MINKRKKYTLFTVSLVSVFIIQACSIPFLGPFTFLLKSKTEPTAPVLPATEMVAVQTPIPTIAPVIPTQPPPEPTPRPTATPRPIEATATSEPAPDIQQQIENANILIFEDIRGHATLSPWVTTITRNMGLKNVVNVGDATGNFLKELNSGTKWDLVIVSAETRSEFRGELFEDLYQHVVRGTSAIIEIWYLNKIANGKIAPLLDRCGVTFQKNWERAPGADILDFSMYWLTPDHPVLNQPNKLDPLYTSVNYWEGDAGDFIRLTGKGDAVLLAGLYPNYTDQFGTLASCMEGRVILQTFSDHDYLYNKVSPLWENYIYNTLLAHFTAQP